jgi:aminopeptidase-like protein
MKKVVIQNYIQILILLLLSSASIQAQSADGLLVDKDAAPFFLGELSGERAMDYIHKISRFHRIRGGGAGSGYDRAVDFVVNELKRIGMDDIKVERFPSDGFTTYLGWPSPVGWRVRSAKLWIVEPEWELIADFSHQAVSLMPYSSGASDQAEVVYVGEGKSDKDYDEIDVKGKIVFATGGNGDMVHKKAVLERKAVGVVVGPSNREDRMEFADLVEMYRLSPTGEERAHTKWGFALSQRQANHLLKLIQGKEKVVMKAEVDADLFDGEMPVISAAVKGTRFPDQEIILMGHLDHYKPGANDNASGSAGMMEIARTLITLIKEGKIKPPARTIRFLWLPELHGAMAYVSKFTDIGQRGLAGINLDMIGEDYEKCRSLLYATTPPYSAPGYIGEVIEDALKWVDTLTIHSPRGSFNRFNFRNVGYWGGSDHAVFCDPTIGVPSVMIGHADVFHHSSYDTPDKCDPTELKRVMAATSMATWVIANATDQWAVKIASAVHRKWLNQLHKRTAQSMDWLSDDSESEDFSKRAGSIHRKTLDYSRVIANVEKKALEEVKKLCQGSQSCQFINRLSQSTANHSKLDNRSLTDFYQLLCKRKKIAAPKPALTPREKYAQSIIPKRLQRGPLPFRFLQHQLGDDYEWYTKNQDKIGEGGRNKSYEVLNLSDGTHNALFIRDVISVEFGEADIEYVLHLLEDLKKLGVIELKNTPLGKDKGF